MFTSTFTITNIVSIVKLLFIYKVWFNMHVKHYRYREGSTKRRCWSYLLALDGADSGRDGDGAGGVHVFGQCERLVHGQAGHVGVQVTTDETHRGRADALYGAAIPGVLAVVPIGRLASERQTKEGLYRGPAAQTSRAINAAFSGLGKSPPPSEQLDNSGLDSRASFLLILDF